MSTSVNIFTVLDNLKFLFFCIYLPYFASCTCPDDVATRARACLRNYDMKMQGVLQPGSSVISGVDAENLRLLCTDFKNGVACIADLKSKCPQENALIEAELIQIPLAINELSDLCRDDSLYDIYARNRYCFEQSGPGNVQCFMGVMNSTIKIITDFNQGSVMKYCSDVEKLLSCIGKSLMAQPSCTPEALGTLKDKLTRVLIRGSLECDKSAYTVSSQRTTPSGGTNSASISLPNRTLASTLVVIFSLVLSFS